jgi:3-methyladenine DNA glycosylase AlkC
MTQDNSVKKRFGEHLAQLLGAKIFAIYPAFNLEKYITTITQQCQDMSYTQRVLLHAETLHALLSPSYPEALQILLATLWDENPNETGMFKEYYRIMPIGKFVELYGLAYFDESIQAITEITKRNTGEYAIRPFLKKYPERTIQVMQQRALSPNFHLRRLASEGCRPKLPWATKLDMFIEDPDPVFVILEYLITDPIKFVQKSVANNITDYLKVNKPAVTPFIKKHNNSDNKSTQWILKHATRKITL